MERNYCCLISVHKMSRLALLLFGFGFSLGLNISACHPKVIPIDTPVHKGHYAYMRIADSVYVVAAVNTPALRQALNEIGCGPKIQCLIEKRGDLFVVEQNKTK